MTDGEHGDTAGETVEGPTPDPEGVDGPAGNGAAGRGPAEATDGSGTTGATERIGLAEARRTAIESVEELLEYDVDGVVRVERADDGWRALVEVVERSAVPDTQDIIGRYEVELDEAGTLVGYGLQERFRRGDMKEEL